MPLGKRPLTRRTALSLTGGFALSATLGSFGALGRRIDDRSDATERIRFKRIGRYETDQFDGGAEDIAFYPASQRLFVVDTATGVTTVLSASDPSELIQEEELAARDAFEAAGTTTSIDISEDTIAVVATHKQQQAPGRVIVYDAETLVTKATVSVGPTPDMVTFTPDGNHLLIANVGSAGTGGENGGGPDPRGSVSVIDLRDGLGNHAVETAAFRAFDGTEDELRDEGVRIYSNSNDGRPVASRDLEPAYIAPTADSRSAFVSLQVNNAIAKLDVESASFTEIIGLGTTDFSEEGNALVTSTVEEPSLNNWPLEGFYQPDGIHTSIVDGETYVLTANEGASRAFEETQVTDMDLDPDGFELSEFPVDSIEDLKNEENIGQLTVTNRQGDPDGDGRFENLSTFGSRSFSVRDESGELVFDSTDEFERIAADRYPKGFDDTDITKSGPQPETVITGPRR